MFPAKAGHWGRYYIAGIETRVTAESEAIGTLTVS